MNAQEIVAKVVEMASVEVEGKEEKVLDFELFKETIDLLVKKRVEEKEKNKTAEKEQKEANKEAKAELAKAFFATLSEGSPITWTMADGSVITGTVGKQKDGAKTAHLLKDEYEKKPDSYVPFYKINVPAGFEKKDEQVA